MRELQVSSLTSATDNDMFRRRTELRFRLYGIEAVFSGFPVLKAVFSGLYFRGCIFGVPVIVTSGCACSLSHRWFSRCLLCSSA